MHARTKKTFLMAAGLLAMMLAAASDAGAVPPLGGPGPGPNGGPGNFRPPPGGRPQDRALYREERFIVQLYQGFLNRRPSPDEVRSWGAKMGGGASPGDLVRVFMDSDEYFIRQTYRGLLGREPDPSGMNTFSAALRGGQSRSDVVETIIRSEEFRKRLQ